MPQAPFLDEKVGVIIELGCKRSCESNQKPGKLKNQGSCGSCWAFSTACTLEGTGFVSTGRLVSVSEQSIVDCDGDDDGCNGGLWLKASSLSSSPQIVD